VLSGINPNVARSIIHMGVELSGIQTYRSLRDALQHHVRRQARGSVRTSNGGTDHVSPKADEEDEGGRR
jgi:hypothetical protein